MVFILAGRRGTRHRRTTQGPNGNREIADCYGDFSGVAWRLLYSQQNRNRIQQGASAAMTGNWWRHTVLSQLSRSPGNAAVLFLVVEDGTKVITFPRLNWGFVAVASAAVLVFAIAVLLLVNSAHFEEPQAPAPAPPASCEPFCPTPN
ncbi:hypothetical protein [Nocardia sp. NPDC059239]|uniref:hypothetical protein n=1 Tax=unclassified Nocardia TaxID=2637762 RepID=UPI0036A2EDA7